MSARSQRTVFLLGIMDIVRVPQVPVTAHKDRRVQSLDGGHRRVSPSWLRFHRAGPDDRCCQSEVKFQMKDPGSNATTVTYFGMCNSAAPALTSSSLVDDVMNCVIRSTFVVVPPPVRAGSPVDRPPTPPA